MDELDKALAQWVIDFEEELQNRGRGFDKMIDTNGEIFTREQSAHLLEAISVIAEVRKSYDYSAQDAKSYIICKIRDERNRRHLTQHDLAELSDVSQIAIQRLECGETDPQISSVIKLLLALNKKIVIIDGAD